MANASKDKSVLVCEPMSVGELATRLNKPITSVIAFLLKHGVVAAKNVVVTADVVAQVAEFFEVEVCFPEEETCGLSEFHDEVAGAKSFIRPPVVVVVGHVDHGKTTLLDHIRNTRVAAREKGGITQHIGAYEAKTAHGKVVFIDTPGHEAFSVMRAHGVTTADIVILVVGADNGVMPQTIEALEMAQQAGTPIVVAINKIDRANARQIDEVKHALSRHGLQPDEWGGDTIFVPISALKGTGVDELLEAVALQAYDLGLETYLDVPPCGYVLESRLEKGRGAVATVISRRGILRIGDLFIAGGAPGKITSMKNAEGKSIKEAYPSVPVVIAGFSELPQPGDVLRSVELTEWNKMRAQGNAPDRKTGSSAAHLTAAQQKHGAPIKLIVRASTNSSRDVLVSSLEKISKKTFSGVTVLSSGVGPATESDIVFASDTGSMVLSLDAKTETKAVRLAQDLGVTVKHFDIIYKLLEYIEELAQKDKPAETKIVKTGEALILKVFDIKNLGIVAGARVVDGFIKKTATVRIYRSNRKIGEGKLTSLQRDRNQAKEVKKGFECAFMVDKFNDWVIDDRVEFYDEVVVPESH